MPFKTATVVLAAAVAQNGTITVGYPTGTDSGSFVGAYAHKAQVSGLQATLSAPAGFTAAFGATAITVTYLGATTIPANTRITFQFDMLGAEGDNFVKSSVNSTTKLTPVVINLGAPDVADPDGVCASQSITAAGAINGALATGGVATFDRPRNVVAAWTTAAVMTVTGTDEYGKVVVEASASGVAFTGKKAFKTITSVAVSTAVTLATVGTGDVLGLPVALPAKSLVLRESEDGSPATAGTLVAAIRTTANATTGDVRGTYDPNSACDGAKAFELIALIPDTGDRGVPQFAG